MPDFRKLEDLFKHQLRDIYSAENQMINILPEMAGSASHTDLTDVFIRHLTETKEHKKRLNSVADELNIDIEGVNCEPIEGMINKTNPFINQPITDEVKDAGIIANGQRLEHYEISAYASLVRYADALCYFRVAKILKQTMAEESNTDQRLNELAIDNANKQARPYLVRIMSD